MMSRISMRPTRRSVATGVLGSAGPAGVFVPGSARRGVAAAIVGALLCASALAQPPAAKGEPGWTGGTHAEDVIFARRSLMLELQALMVPIDSHAAGEDVDPEELRAAARTIAAMLAAVPHLFPPTTNRYDPDADAPVTLALPSIWDDFPAFYSLASAAAASASSMASIESPADLRPAAAALRGACDGCHGLYMREYTAPEVSSEDLEFDFDSLFEGSVE